MMRTMLLGAITAAWGFVVFVVGLHVNFPSEALLDRAQWEVQDRSKGEYALQALDARLWRLTGLQVDDAVLMQIDQPRRRKGEDQEALASPLLRVDSLAARIRLLPLLRGTQELGFQADVFGGKLGGVLSQSSTGLNVEAEGGDLDVSRMPIAGEGWSVDATGIAHLDIDMLYGTEDVKDSMGKISLEIDNLELIGIDMGGFNFDQPMNFTEAVIELDIDKGKATFDRGRFVSDQLTATITGDITLNKRGLASSRLRLDLSVELGPELEQLARLAQLSDSKNADGAYDFICTGMVSSPRCRPKGGKEGLRAAGGKAGRGRPRVERDDEEEDDGSIRPPREGLAGSVDMDDEDRRAAREERREARLERLRERRERLKAERDDGDGLEDEFDPLDRPASLRSPVGPRGLPDLPREDFADDLPADDLEFGDFDEVEPADFDEFEGDFED